MPSFEDMLKPRTGAQPALTPVAPSTPVAASTAFDQMLQSGPARQPNVPSQPAVGYASSSLEQCQPVLRPDSSSVWSQAELEMNRIYAAVTGACANLGIDAYVGRNNSFDFSYTVVFQAWLPLDNDPYLTDRVHAHITLTPRPSHKYPIEYTIKIFRLSKKNQEKIVGIYGAFTDANVATLLNYLVRGSGAEPKFPHEIVQPHHNFFQKLIKAKNKFVGIKVDYWAASVLWLMLGAGVGAWVLSGIDMTFAFGSGAIAVISLIVLIILAKRPVVIRSTGRPDFQPRTLRLYDTWQVVLSGAGTNRDVFYERFLDVLRRSPIQDFKAQVELIGYRVLNEPLWREQLVLSARRSVIYCHIYPFGDDLYIGWQSFLNRGCWIETALTEGVDRASGRRVKLQGVMPGSEGLCEYDYVDTNCLTEWIHSQMVALIKQLMAELQIDQEIDFKIVRGERAAAEDAEDKKEKKSGGLFRRKH